MWLVFHEKTDVEFSANENGKVTGKASLPIDTVTLLGC